MTKEAKKSLAASRKEKREALRAKFGKALLDGKEIEIANWMAEPPGLFMGRGAHPLRGSWKPGSRRTTSRSTSTRTHPFLRRLQGHARRRVDLDRALDRQAHREGEVRLAPRELGHPAVEEQAEVRQGDQHRRQACRGSRAAIRKKLGDKDEKERKIATVCYLIDEVGMRVGDEKDEDEADTVGATTLEGRARQEARRAGRRVRLPR